MGTNTYSPAVLDVLLAGGWTPGRAVDISEFTTSLESRGFTVSVAAAQVLAEFYGLSFAPTLPGAHAICFGAESLPWTPKKVSSLERVADEACCLVGAKSHGDVFVTPLGHVIILDTDWLFVQRAPDLPHCFESLFVGRQDILATRWLSRDELPEYLRQPERNI
jgi:hypothetical protein